MSIPRPKILTVVTVPTGGYDIRVYITDSSAFDTAVTAAIPAGDYYVAWDYQDDDFLFVFCNVINVAVATAGSGFGYGGGAGVLVGEMDSANKVKLYAGAISGHADRMRIDWAYQDGATVAAILGFNPATTPLDITDTYPTRTGTWQHAYGWYADEDGSLSDDAREDVEMVNALQSFAPSGESKTIYIDSTYSNRLGLMYVKRERMLSAGQGYTDASVDPYERNVPLQCWFARAKLGDRFRVYRYNQTGMDVAVLAGSTSGFGTNVTPADTAKSLDIDPQEVKGHLFVQGFVVGYAGSSSVTIRATIESHTATVMTIPNNINGITADDDKSETYRVIQGRYQTYVLDLNKMREFAPTEHDAIDRFSITLPLRRYVS